MGKVVEFKQRPSWADDFYTIEEIAAFMGLATGTLENRIRLKMDHPPVVPGRGKAKRFPKDEFNKWIKTQIIRQA